jgi:hypothetical protein
MCFPPIFFLIFSLASSLALPALLSLQDPYISLLPLPPHVHIEDGDYNVHRKFWTASYNAVMCMI